MASQRSPLLCQGPVLDHRRLAGVHGTFQLTSAHKRFQIAVMISHVRAMDQNIICNAQHREDHLAVGGDASEIFHLRR